MTTIINEKEKYIIIGIEDGWIKIDKKIWQQYQQLKEKERSIKLDYPCKNIKKGEKYER